MVRSHRVTFTNILLGEDKLTPTFY